MKDGNIIVDGEAYISEKNKEAYDYNLQQFKEFSEELKNYGY
ncbi:hypothetical protein [Streptococcus acidominimus]|nr:hypothetical protein [Streptococcus acidominimus]